jgi:formate dehydrogenase maturation protein FdhE
MTWGCKGLCDIMPKPAKPKTGSRYVNGQKRCKVCDRYWLTIAIHCPCCGARMQNRLKYLRATEKIKVVRRNKSESRK